VGAYSPGTLEGAQMGDILEFLWRCFWSVFGILSILSLYWSYRYMKGSAERSQYWDKSSE
jgi:hypothetical protein